MSLVVNNFSPSFPFPLPSYFLLPSSYFLSAVFSPFSHRTPYPPVPLTPPPPFPHSPIP